MSLQRTRTQYRLTIQREGNAPKHLTAFSMKTIEKRLVLIGPEPWEAYTDKEPDELQCCAGTVYDECACGGLTVREAAMEKRKDLPPVTSTCVQSRQVVTTRWECESLVFYPPEPREEPAP